MFPLSIQLRGFGFILFFIKSVIIMSKYISQSSKKNQPKPDFGFWFIFKSSLGN